jgi:hypothetical protein
MSDPKLIRDLARAAITVALEPWSSHSKTAEHLRQAARIDPGAIVERIGELRAKIALLESYLPEAKAS